MLGVFLLSLEFLKLEFFLGLNNFFVHFVELVFEDLARCLLLESVLLGDAVQVRLMLLFLLGPDKVNFGLVLVVRDATWLIFQVLKLLLLLALNLFQLGLLFLGLLLRFF